MKQLSPSSRRGFLQVLGSLAAGWALSPWPVWLDVPARSREATSRLSLGLFFDEARLKGMTERLGSPRFSSLRDDLLAIDRASLLRFIDAEVRYNDHLYDFQRLQTVAPRLAFQFALTGDAEAAALARDVVRTILRFPKWDYFLDASDEILGIQRASGAVVAVACAADWLGPMLDAGERDEWLRAMADRGCAACFRSIRGMRYPGEAGGWHIDPESTYLEHRPGDRSMDLSNWPRILDRTNLKAVPAAALAIGAVAYERHFGADAASARWLEQATHSIGTFQHLYAPDGSYDEGISYANYTSQHLAQATEVLHRHAGVDLYDVVNWPGFIDYACGLSMPTADDPFAVVNFGDAGTGLRSDVAYWIAARSGDERAQWFGEHKAHAHTEWSLMWFDAERASEAPPPGPSVWHSDLDWIVARTGYDADDLVVAMRSGGPSNHEHADRNSVIVKAYGEVLVADPYRPPYGRTDPSWSLRTTAGHSALLIDGAGHQYHDGSEGTNPSDAEARIVRTQERDGYVQWASDATPAYRLVLPHVRSVTRSVLVLFDLAAVILVDKVVTDGAPVTLRARFYGDDRDGGCTIEAEASAFTIHRPHAHLTAHGYVAGGCTASTSLLPIPPERARHHPFADVAAATPSVAPCLITVLGPCRADGPLLTVDASREGDRWTLALMRDEAMAAIHVQDAGTLPELLVESNP